MHGKREKEKYELSLPQLLELSFTVVRLQQPQPITLTPISISLAVPV